MIGDCAAVTAGRPSDFDFDFDVVVVGFGPVGAVAACLLGQQGRRVLVLDRERDIFPLPRAIVLDDEAMRLFRSLGLSDQIEPFTTPIRTVEFADPAEGRLVGYDVPYDVPKRGSHPQLQGLPYEVSTFC